MPLPIGSFAGVKEADFGVLIGKFNGVIESAEHRAVKPDTADKWDKKHPNGEPHPGYVAWTISSLAPIDNPSDDTYSNRKCWHNTTLDPDSKGMLLSVLLAIGYERSTLDAPDFALDLEEQSGKPIGVRLGTRKGDDTQSEVKEVFPVGAGAKSLLD